METSELTIGAVQKLVLELETRARIETLRIHVTISIEY